MKNTLTSLLLLCQFVMLWSQPITSGKIKFKETIKFKFDIDGGNEELMKMMPTSQSVDKILYFNSTESLYKNVGKLEDMEIKKEDEGNQFQMVIKMPESITYINIGDKTMVQTQDLMGKEFLIVDIVEKKNWKVTGEQKNILDYVCQKAILNDTVQNIIAWFTPQIPVSIGPGGLTGLPGMILAIEQDNGDRTTIATSFEQIESDFAFVKPNKGKTVKKSEFEKIRAEKMKEMGATDGKGNGIKMIIREEKH